MFNKLNIPNLPNQNPGILNGYQIISSSYIKSTEYIVSENPKMIIVHPTIYNILLTSKDLKNLSKEQREVLTKHKNCKTFKFGVNYV